MGLNHPDISGDHVTLNVDLWEGVAATQTTNFFLSNSSVWKLLALVFVK